MSCIYGTQTHFRAHRSPQIDPITIQRIQVHTLIAPRTILQKLICFNIILKLTPIPPHMSRTLKLPDLSLCTTYFVNFIFKKSEKNKEPAQIGVGTALYTSKILIFYRSLWRKICTVFLSLSTYLARQLSKIGQQRLLSKLHKPDLYNKRPFSFSVYNFR
jgi:hypothetical protein